MAESGTKERPAKKAKTKKAKRTAKKSKGEQIAEVVDLLTKIEEAEDAVLEAENEVDTRREELKTAKGVWHTRVSEMRELVRTRKRWAEEAKRQPLFANQSPANGQAVTEQAGDGTQPPKSEADMQIEDLGVSAARCEKLGLAGLHTVAQLRDAMVKNPREWFKPIAGIGRDAATDIEDRVNALPAATAT